MSLTNPQKRLESELTNIRRNPPENCSAQPTPNDFLKWTATISGPANTPYQNGLFKLQMTFPPNYPIQPPSINFTTKIYHPNIEADSGFIAVDILHEAWSPVLTIPAILYSLQALLSSPDTTNAVVPEIAHQYAMRSNEYFSEAARWTRKYAT